MNGKSQMEPSPDQRTLSPEEQAKEAFLDSLEKGTYDVPNLAEALKNKWIEQGEYRYWLNKIMERIR
ncbi:hypothetical protein A3D43_02380 [Candidatus Nomurabacteria bacterium RIFCSPHIGHO2_02_FULL_41_52]|uniref:Uncharacterized protein n=1 Tax=Candidatus Nomurabacteria bacterium RIFCSPLOWO2_12_FULL_41_10 TaxID=1801795 RepID=A0A1F6YAA5_9BACT|nr:MAG: hypothetical protein A3D43_02380 [Candidatus Nomurabacteria bacterium RIFCSPHIGHO2_02_FULL_41_52]OGI84604.1 MAG: hypothetical protein A3F49_02055 [Candidatus Nomurabacteria bacterium RIFCSPHIGHO2_12_FULL_42_19]OGI97693.1 MAG: hypothetical protein A3H56_02320 [Candidatus Nomurabacteria bacterium RIFCSPLOWO2_02_FULL_42_24]OGJ03295.1 MAG: hypothetical protein A3F97_00890 [Candidatus Nomurabacteria bacterium RIFCSPLOWO2_12_FULL_41_10]